LQYSKISGPFILLENELPVNNIEENLLCSFQM